MSKDQANPAPFVPRRLTTHLALSEHIPTSDILSKTLDGHIDILAVDPPGPGGASHEYHLTVRHEDDRTCHGYEIKFQKGPVKEAGYNGVSQEALLAVLIDRLDSFQNGPFPCKENADALHHLRCAMACLHTRTKDRIQRQVEGQTKA